jgi:hypothetical protein
MCDDVRGLFGSRGCGTSCSTSGCGESGHRLLGR